jgi:salicylate hydroxylase
MAVTRAVRIGFCQLEPRLDRWVYGNVVLVGDAAHPPVPYTGQGAQMGLEDAGVLAMLLKRYCIDKSGEFHMEGFGRAMRLYERVRIPRCQEVQEKADALAARLQKMAENSRYTLLQQELLPRQVFFNGTLPEVLPAAKYDYRVALEKVLVEEEKNRLPPVYEHEEEET